MTPRSIFQLQSRNVNMPNIVDFPTAEGLSIRITQLINNTPGRTNGNAVAALLVALGDFIQSIDCPRCRANATEEAVRVAADIHQCFGQAGNGTSDHVH
jgi:hypothetical protein